ncbi:MAG: BrnT family toxin [Candidatus Electrothrix sp. MAN1_4]|nr:BrnT family toxin [Candidatus Electrothrix sp. MAN1_4]
MLLRSKLLIILVVHCFRENNSTISIISARKATKQEMKEYYGA